MTASRLKLLLTIFWLVPAFALFGLEWANGPVVALPVAGRQIPLAWICQALGLLNLARWWWTPRPSSRRWIERRRSRPATPEEPNPDFRFDK